MTEYNIKGDFGQEWIYPVGIYQKSAKLAMLKNLSQKTIQIYMKL